MCNLRSEFIQILHIPSNMEMCRWFFQGFTEIQNGRHWSILIFLWARKNQKISSIIFLKFQLYIPSNVDILLMLPVFKMSFRGQLKFFCGRKNSKTSSQKLFKFYNQITHDMEKCSYFFTIYRQTSHSARSSG